MGNDNLERNQISEPKKFSCLCTFKVVLLHLTDRLSGHVVSTLASHMGGQSLYPVGIKENVDQSLLEKAM